MTEHNKQYTDTPRISPDQERLIKNNADKAIKKVGKLRGNFDRISWDYRNVLAATVKNFADIEDRFNKKICEFNHAQTKDRDLNDGLHTPFSVSNSRACTLGRISLELQEIYNELRKHVPRLKHAKKQSENKIRMAATNRKAADKHLSQQYQNSDAAFGRIITRSRKATDHIILSLKNIDVLIEEYGEMFYQNFKNDYTTRLETLSSVSERFKFIKTRILGAPTEEISLSYTIELERMDMRISRILKNFTVWIGEFKHANRDMIINHQLANHIQHGR